MTTAAEILNKAAAHLQDRASTYDKPSGERSMGATVAAFSSITGITLTTEQGWMFMAVLKAVRSQQGAYREDSYSDGAAYFALACETAAIDRMTAQEVSAKLKEIAKPATAPTPSQVRADYPQLAEVADHMSAQAALREAQVDAKEGWIEWKGGECPVDETELVEIRLEIGYSRTGVARSFDWHNRNLLAYRIASTQPQVAAQSAAVPEGRSAEHERLVEFANLHDKLFGLNQRLTQQELSLYLRTGASLGVPSGSVLYLNTLAEVQA